MFGGLALSLSRARASVVALGESSSDELGLGELHAREVSVSHRRRFAVLDTGRGMPRAASRLRGATQSENGHENESGSILNFTGAHPIRRLSLIVGPHQTTSAESCRLVWLLARTKAEQSKAERALASLRR